MIQFGTASLFILDAAGNEHSYDLDALRDRLSIAFLQQGIQENWLAENLVLTIEEKQLCRALGRRLARIARRLEGV